MRSFGDPSSNRREDRRTKEMRLLTAGQLRGRLDENPHLRENCYSFMRDISGTQAYWNSLKIQLYAMFRTLGPPTFFINLSADDNNWTDLMVILSKCKGQNLSEEQASELSPSEKRALMTTKTPFTRAQLKWAGPVMMSSALFGLVKNGHCKRDRANRNWAGPLGPGPAHRTG